MKLQLSGRHWMLICGAVLALPLLLWGCRSTGGDPATPKAAAAAKTSPAPQATPAAVLTPSTTHGPPGAHSNADVAVSAVIEGDKLHVSVRNLTQAPLVLVGPKNFALFLPSRQLIKFKDYEPGMPIKTLQPGEQMEGLLPLRGLNGKTKGAHLGFQHSGARSLNVPIRTPSNAPTMYPSSPVQAATPSPPMTP